MVEVNTTKLIENVILSINSNLNLEMSDINTIKSILDFNLGGCMVSKEEGTEVSANVDQTSMYMKEYLLFLKMKGCTPKSISAYKLDIEKMLIYIDKDIDKIDYRDINKYLAYGKITRNWKPRTYNTKLIMIRGFFTWLTEEGIIAVNPASKLHSSKVEHKLGNVLTGEQREMIRCACSSERDLSICDLLYSSGIRVSELTKLNISDINFDNCSAVVYGKGQKEREIFFSPSAKVHLLNYIDSRDDDNEALFVSDRKPHNRLSINSIQRNLKKIVKNNPELGNIKLSPHVFRRSVGTDMLNKGAALEVVAEKLGHVNMQVTKDCYAFMSKRTLQQAHNRYVN